MADSTQNSEGLAFRAKVMLLIALCFAMGSASCRPTPKITESSSNEPVRERTGPPDGIHLDLENSENLISFDAARGEVILHRNAVRNEFANHAYNTQVSVFLHAAKPDFPSGRDMDSSEGELAAVFYLGPVWKGGHAPNDGDISKPMIHRPTSQRIAWIRLKLSAEGENGSLPNPLPAQLAAPYTFTSLDWRPHEERSHYLLSKKYRLWGNAGAILFLIIIITSLILAVRADMAKQGIGFRASIQPHWVSFIFPAGLALAMLLLVVLGLLAWWRDWPSPAWRAMADWPLVLGRSITHFSSAWLHPVSKENPAVFIAILAVPGGLAAGGGAFLWGRAKYSSRHPKSLTVYRTVAVAAVTVALGILTANAGLSWKSLQQEEKTGISPAGAAGLSPKIAFEVLTSSLNSYPHTGTPPVLATLPTDPGTEETSKLAPPSPVPSHPDSESEKPSGDTPFRIDFDKVPKAIEVREQSFYGIGVQPSRGKDSNGTLMQVTSVLPGGPAFLAGIEAEDFLVAVDGQAVADLTAESVLEMLRSDHESNVILRITRKGQPMEFPLRRARVTTIDGEFSSVESPRDYIKGYVWTARPTLHRLKRGVTQLKVRAIPGAKGREVGKLLTDAVVQILGEAESAPDGGLWVPIKSASIRGWVNAAYIGPGSFAAEPEPFIRRKNE